MNERDDVSRTVTVAIPTLDRPRLLTRALRSVLGQGIAEVEVVVSDNASSVDLPAVVEQLNDSRVVFQRHEQRLSMTENWNSCLATATGDYFLLLSDDDALAPGGLESLRRCFLGPDGQDDPSAHAAYGRALVIDGAGRALWRSLQGTPEESAAAFFGALLRHRRALYLCGTLLRRSALLAIGGYDGERFGPAADLGAALQVALTSGSIRYTDAIVAYYTEHEANISAQLDMMRWNRAVTAVGDAVLGHPSVPPQARPGLRRDLTDYAAYAVMDIARASAAADHASVLKTWWRAERARIQAGCPTAPKASARLLVKLAYLRAVAGKQRLQGATRR